MLVSEGPDRRELFRRQFRFRVCHTRILCEKSKGVKYIIP
jgi:hypothetical protein